MERTKWQWVARTLRRASNAGRLALCSSLVACCLAASAGATEPSNSSSEPARKSSDRAQPSVIAGLVDFEPGPDEAKVAEQFRMTGHKFDFVQSPLADSSRVLQLWTVTFPSPVVTPHPNNNTVHCEYFQPLTPGKHPGVIVLHILGGDFDLSRLFCRSLAHHGVAALFVKLPYYGPRRQPEVKVRMVSTDPHETVRGMTQAVLDVRQATAWLGSRDEVDPQQLGIMGISLGGITGALALSAEPRLQSACLLLAGGDIGEVVWNVKEIKQLREKWLADGGTKESLIELLRTVDPATYAERARGKRILMLNASNDEVIPKACTESLWRAFGKPAIIWWPAGHYSAIGYIFEGLARATRFFADPQSVDGS